jgi:hypothetical protein
MLQTHTHTHTHTCELPVLDFRVLSLDIVAVRLESAAGPEAHHVYVVLRRALRLFGVHRISLDASVAHAPARHQIIPGLVFTAQRHMPPRMRVSAVCVFLRHKMNHP